MLIEINVPTTELAVFAREPVAAVAAIINTPAAAAATHTRRRVLRDHFCLPIISPKRTREGIAPLPVAHRPASFLPSPHPMMDQREVLLVLLILHPNVGLGFFLVEAATLAVAFSLRQVGLRQGGWLETLSVFRGCRRDFQSVGERHFQLRVVGVALRDH